MVTSTKRTQSPSRIPNWLILLIFSPLLRGHLVSFKVIFQGILTRWYANHVQFLSTAHQTQHHRDKNLIKTRTSNKCGFVWANRPSRALCSTRQIPLLLTLLAANHKKNCHLQRDIRKEYTKYTHEYTVYMLQFHLYQIFTALASNRPTEALASVISFTFVVYSHYKHS